MSYLKGLMLSIVCLLGLTAALAAPPAGVRTWFVDSLVKIFPSDALGTHRLLAPEFLGARNQHVSVQLAIRSATPLPALSAEVAPLDDGSGGKIAAVQVRHVGYVVVGSHTPDTPAEELVGEAPGWYPDPLLDFPFDLEANRTHSVWVTVHVPSDARPGIYRGAVTLRTGKGVVARAPFRLRVVTATVPQERSLKVTNWFGFDDRVSRQFYGVPAFSEEWWTLVENVARVMADHRQNVIITPLLELIHPHAKAGEISYDFRDFDRWVETFRRAGALRYIEGGHLLGRGGESYEGSLEIPTFQLAGGRVQKESLPPEDARVEQFLTGFLTALNAHLEEKGWKSSYLQHILDEAHGSEPPYYQKFAEMVHRCLPGVPTIDAVDAAEMPEELQKNCDVWVSQLGRFDNQMELLQQRIAGGHEVWFYTCLVPNGRYLNRLLDYPLLKVRLLHWLNFRHNFTGFLHWGGNYWGPEPMKDTQPVINANTTLLPPGDAFIMYPDRAHKSVLSSIRLEAMREGIEDYELLRALKAKNPAEADRLAKVAVSSFTEYVREPAAFRQLERDLLQALAN